MIRLTWSMVMDPSNKELRVDACARVGALDTTQGGAEPLGIAMDADNGGADIGIGRGAAQRGIAKDDDPGTAEDPAMRVAAGA
mmetsp:Transcript_16471/g.47028  ORF Transcript_16471/g.47028 Transcript_16471/m.47028 type:complete len:83 (-) Transcript_16471:1128-1376(-)